MAFINFLSTGHKPKEERQEEKISQLWNRKQTFFMLLSCMILFLMIDFSEFRRETTSNITSG